MSTRGLPGTTAELSIDRVIRVERGTGRCQCFGRWRHSCGEPGHELFWPDTVAGSAGGDPDAPFHCLGQCVSISEAHVTGDGLEGVGGFTQKGICAEQSGAGDEFTGRHEPGALEAAIERAPWDPAAVGNVGNTAKPGRIANQPLQSASQWCRRAAQRPRQERQEAFGEYEARLTLQHAPELLWIVIEPVEDELFHAVAAQFDERPERLSGEDRIHDHGERPVPVMDGSNAVGPWFGGRIELGVDDQNVDRLPSDDRVGVGPIECCVHTMPITRCALEAGELGRLDAGGDVHNCLVATLSGWGQND